MPPPEPPGSLDTSVLQCALVFGLPPVALGALLLLTPWGAPPTSRQLSELETTADSVGM